MSLDVNIKLLESDSVIRGSSCKLELNFSNNSKKDILIDNIFIYFENHCLISVINLKRFNKQNDIDLFLQKLLFKYEIFNDSVAKDQSKSSNHLIIHQTSTKLVEKGILKAEDSFKMVAKVKIPEETIITYKSKCIQFWSSIKLRVVSHNCHINLEKFIIPLQITNNYLSSPISTLGNDDIQYNPFEINENQSNFSLTNEFPTEMLLDRHSNAKYRITYQNSEMCYLTLLKSQIYVGDDINIILNFVPMSVIRCLKFAIILKVKENLLIPNEYPKANSCISLSTREFGPFQHNSSFIEIFPVSIKVPNDQYPSMESDIFQLSWFLEFKFMISDSKDISLNSNQDSTNETQAISWELNQNNKADLLTWELPLIIYQQMKSDLF